MAPNKFATMLHKNTHKMTAILVYAALEWLLIFFLLLNSLFNYLITKFANFFGLKPPCPFCSRLDHLFESETNPSYYRDLVCESHGCEISKLGYCSNHQKLAETEHMCEDCLSSRPDHVDDPIGMTRRLAFLSWVSENKIEIDEKIFRCSCCNESLTSKVHPPYLLWKPSWAGLDYTQKGNLNLEATNHEKGEGDHQIVSDIESFILREVSEDRSSSVSNMQGDEREADKEEKESDSTSATAIIKQNICCNNDLLLVNQSSESAIVKGSFVEDKSLGFIDLHFEKYAGPDTNRLIPVDLIDSFTSVNSESCKVLESDVTKQYSSDSGLQIDSQLNVIGDENEEETREEQLESTSETERLSRENNAEEVLQDMEVGASVKDLTYKNNASLSIEDNKGEIAMKDQKNMLSVNQPQSQDLVRSSPRTQEDQSSSSSDDDAEIHNAFDEFISQNNLSAGNDENNDMLEKNEDLNHEFPKCTEAFEAEDKLPETPTLLDSLHYLHKKLMLFERKEGAEESVDGSVVCEVESSDPQLTIEWLKASLKDERKTLSALYQELEEERSASAVAANQTMAMITRLQEEKAAMQMEALQYQRMMEEQSEYDQEALQLLNELMVKREKEKQELEKELEVYRKKVEEYETKEKIRTLRWMKRGAERRGGSSTSCSNMMYTDDGISIDLNKEASNEENGYYSEEGEIQNLTSTDSVTNLEEMAMDCVKHITDLDDSLAEFEEERLSILDQLKALQEKLIGFGDEEFLEDVKLIDQDLNDSGEFSSPEENGVLNGFSDDKDCAVRKTMGSLAKRLLPILDAAENESENVESPICHDQAETKSVEIQDSFIPEIDIDTHKLAVDKEVNHVYQRLQALEADRDFLKHCVGSKRKGDKGVDLLQEILQHLQDLIAVELGLKNMNVD